MEESRKDKLGRSGKMKVCIEYNTLFKALIKYFQPSEGVESFRLTQNHLIDDVFGKNTNTNEL